MRGLDVRLHAVPFLNSPMKAIPTVLAITSLCLPSCQFSYENSYSVQRGGHQASTAPELKLPKPKGRYVAAIDAASTIGFSSERAVALRDVAAKHDLSAPEQGYLVDVVRVTGGFSSDVTSILITLLRNPSVTNATRRKISGSLECLGLFSSDATKVALQLAHS